MKIGILTVPFNNNYGGFLQAYALKNVLKDMGHEVIFINRQRNPSTTLKFRVYRMLVKLHLINDYIGDKIRTISVNTDQFRDKYLSPISPMYYSSNAMRDCLKLGIDFLIVGSDQVWRYKYAKDSIDDFFFGFVEESNSIPRISYAASFGTDNMDYPTGKINEIKGLLTRFRAISVREESGKNLLINYFDVPPSNVQTVLDPTLLLNAEYYYNNLFKNIQPETKNYVFTYILDKEMLDTESLHSFVQDNGLLHVDMKAQTGSIKSLDVIEPVEKWLSSIYHADSVVTDSFHGTVFSILFHKQFVVLANPNRGIARLESILKLMGQEDRMLTKSDGNLKTTLLHPINWEVVEERLQSLRAKSMDFLIQSLL